MMEETSGGGLTPPPPPPPPKVAASPTPFRNTVALDDGGGSKSTRLSGSTHHPKNLSQTSTATTSTSSDGGKAGGTTAVRSRNNNNNNNNKSTKKRRRKHSYSHHHQRDKDKRSKCCNRTIVRSTLSCMNLLAKVLVWCSAVASVAAVVWYSYELKNNGTDPHLIAWFSAGAFVLLGFPISIYAIVMHLMNYNQPNVQCYVVRILWMVPIYSIESWLCLRYKDYAIYIETLRDCYESYVLYSFLQFLIQVLGGEDALILMLKDKSPTRGVHMWGLQYCGLKPWLMGQPIRRTYDNAGSSNSGAATTPTATTANNNNNIRYKRVHWTSPFFVYCKFGVLQYVLLKFVLSGVVVILEKNHIYKEGDFTYKGGYLYVCVLTNLSQCWALYCLIFFYYATKNELSPINPVGKFLAVKALVFFTWWQSVCISILYQYNLIPHYHAGMMTMTGAGNMDLSSSTVPSFAEPLTEDAALALDEWGGNSLPTLPTSTSSSTTSTEWTSEDVAKGLQDYLICIEMFVAAVVHIFVFSHTEYDPQAVEARERALNQQPYHYAHNGGHYKRLGRKWKDWDNKSAWSGSTSGRYTTSNTMELVPLPQHENHEAVEDQIMYRTPESSMDEDDLRVHPFDRMEAGGKQQPLLDTVADGKESDDNDDNDDGSFYSLSSSDLNDTEQNEDDDEEDFDDEEEEDDERQTLLSSKRRNSRSKQPPAPAPRRTGFVKALLDSAIPQDLRDNTVGIIKGDYVVERKTLLHHAATSDSYDLFSRVPKLKKSPPHKTMTKPNQQQPPPKGGDQGGEGV